MVRDKKSDVLPLATGARTFTIGLNAKGLLPGQQRTIRARPQATFRPTRVIVDPQCGDAIIHDLSIGSSPQLAGSIPANAFSPSAAPTSLPFSTAHVGAEIVMTVSRPKGGDFQASLLGTIGDDAEVPSWSPAAALDEDLMKVAEDHIKYEEERLKDEEERHILEELE